MKFKNLKPVCVKSTCVAAAASIVRTAMIRGTIEWKCETRTITTTQVQDMAYNIVQAVMNNYKYLKIAE